MTRSPAPPKTPSAPPASAQARPVHPITKKEEEAVHRMEVRLSEPPIAAGVTETAAGATAGAVLGAFAGPLGMVAGAMVGAAAGAIAASAAQSGEDEKAARDLELDEEIGVLGGELGAPNLEHPPARIGAYSAGSMGGGGGGGGTLSEGPIPANDD